MVHVGSSSNGSSVYMENVGSSSGAIDEERTRTAPVEKVTMEDADVQFDDPIKWPKHRKILILVIVSFAAFIAAQAGNEQNPGASHIEEELHASVSGISWSLSLFMLLQGAFPLLWSAISEIKGRKIVYVASVGLFTLGSTGVALARNMSVVIVMRCVQGAGGSAVFAIGAATIADVYAPPERGTMMGWYNSAPMLGRALAPALGGALTQMFSWRAIYWSLVIGGGFLLLSFLLFYKETFRRERSLTYQRATQQLDKVKRLISSCPTYPQIPALRFPDPVFTDSSNAWWSRGRDVLAQARKLSQDEMREAQEPERCRHLSELDLYIAREMPTSPSSAAVDVVHIKDVTLSFKDVNPIGPLWLVLRRSNNIATIISCALIFGFYYSISYTTGRTLGRVYHYDSVEIGFVLLCYGTGSVIGSVVGGRWSDRILSRLKAENNGNTHPEMRLESVKLPMVFLPLSVAGYAWVCQEHIYPAAICVMLFLSGFLSMWIYTGALAYIVDGNPGRSSTAVAAELASRGTAAFVAAEIAIPLQDAIGDGWLYTLWAGSLLFGELLILVVLWRGRQWRESADATEAQCTLQ